MITESYFAKKPANNHIPPPLLVTRTSNPPASSPNTGNSYGLTIKEIAQAARLKISLEEYHKRDKVVKEAFKNCPFREGEVLEPRTEVNMKEYGPCRIVGVAKDYFEYGGVDSDWDNIPRILTFEPVNPSKEQENKHYHGTINWFRKDDKCAC